MNHVDPLQCDHGIYTMSSETGEGECRECGAELRWQRPTTPTIQPLYYNPEGQPISAADYHNHYKNHYKNLPTQHTTQTPPKTQ